MKELRARVVIEEAGALASLQRVENAVAAFGKKGLATSFVDSFKKLGEKSTFAGMLDGIENAVRATNRLKSAREALRAAEAKKAVDVGNLKTVAQSLRGTIALPKTGLITTADAVAQLKPLSDELTGLKKKVTDLNSTRLALKLADTKRADASRSLDKAITAVNTGRDPVTGKLTGALSPAAMAKLVKPFADALKQADKDAQKLRDSLAHVGAIDSREITKLQAKIDALKGKSIGLLTEADTKAIAELQARLTALKGKTVGVLTWTDERQIAKLQAKIDALKNKTVGVLSTADAKAVAELQTKIDAIKGKTAAVIAVADTKAVAELQAKIDALKAKPVTLRTEADTKALQAKIDAIKGKTVKLHFAADAAVAELQAKIDALKGKTVGVLSTVDAKAVAELQTKIDAIKGKTVGVLSTADTKAVADLQTKIDAIKGKTVGVLSTADAKAVAELQTKIDAIKGKTVGILTTADTKAIAELQARIDAIKAKPVTLRTEADTKAITELQAKIDAIKNKTVGVLSTADAKAIAELQTKIDAVKGKTVRVLSEADTKAVADLQTKIDAIKNKKSVALRVETNLKEIATLETRLAALKAKPLHLITKADAREVTTLEKQIAALKDKTVTVRIAGDTRRIAELQGKIDAIKGKTGKDIISPDEARTKMKAAVDAAKSSGAAIKIALAESGSAVLGAVVGAAGALFGILRAVGDVLVGIVKGVLSAVSMALDVIKSFVGSIVKVVGTVGAVIAGIAVTAAGILAKGIHGALKIGSDMQDVHRRTGLGAGDAFEITKAMEHAGISSDLLGTSMNMMQRSLSGINEEGKSTRRTFAALGLTFAELRAMGPAEQFRTIGMRIANLKTPADRAAATMEIFNRRNAAMLQLFENPMVFPMAKEQIGKSGALLEKHRVKFDFVSDSFDGLKTKVQAFFIGVASAMTGPLTFFADKINKMDFTGLGQRLGAKLNTAVTVLYNAFKDGKLWDLAKLGLKAAFTSAGDNLVTVLADAAHFAKSVFADIKEPLTLAILDSMAVIKDALIYAFTAALPVITAVLLQAVGIAGAALKALKQEGEFSAEETIYEGQIGQVAEAVAGLRKREAAGEKNPTIGFGEFAKIEAVGLTIPDAELKGKGKDALLDYEKQVFEGLQKKQEQHRAYRQKLAADAVKGAESFVTDIAGSFPKPDSRQIKADASQVWQDVLDVVHVGSQSVRDAARESFANLFQTAGEQLAIGRQALEDSLLTAATGNAEAARKLFELRPQIDGPDFMGEVRPEDQARQVQLLESARAAMHAALADQPELQAKFDAYWKTFKPPSNLLESIQEVQKFWDAVGKLKTAPPRTPIPDSGEGTREVDPFEKLFKNLHEAPSALEKLGASFARNRTTPIRRLGEPGAGPDYRKMGEAGHGPGYRALGEAVTSPDYTAMGKSKVDMSNLFRQSAASLIGGIFTDAFPVEKQQLASDFEKRSGYDRVEATRAGAPPAANIGTGFTGPPRDPSAAMNRVGANTSNMLKAQHQTNSLLRQIAGQKTKSASGHSPVVGHN